MSANDRYLIRLPRVSEKSWFQNYRPERWSNIHTLSPVFGDSPMPLRRAVEAIAKFFRREFRYDFVQYVADEEQGRDVAVVWDDLDDMDRRFIYGACCFRWRIWKDEDPGWALSWVWFHPFERNQGHLTRAWPHFREVFGDFFVEPPLSPAMRAFVKKIGHPER